MGGEVIPLRLNGAFPARFLRLLQQGRYHVVHSHVHLFSGFLLWLAAHAGVPHRIAHFRNMHDGRCQSFYRKAQTRVMRHLIRNHATAILAVCRGAMESAWETGWETDPRCKIIYNGIDDSQYLPPPDKNGVLNEFGFPADGRVCIHVGRLVEAKNHRKLVQVFARISAADPSVRLLLVGRGGNDLETQLVNQIEDCGLTAKVRLTGERCDVPRLLKASDLMIFPSRWEGLPGAVLEACAAGLPVLASNLPGVAEIARYYPSHVSQLSLDASDQEWEEKALQLLRRASKPESVTSLEDVPFRLQTCADSLCDVWRRFEDA